MALYTRRGDQGETDLLGGVRVPKDHGRVEALGAVDELNASLGIAITFLEDPEVRRILESVQNSLFTVGAEIGQRSGEPSTTVPALTQGAVESLERATDAYGRKVGKQRAFVLPGGSRQAAHLHYARAVARRAERRIVSLGPEENLNPQILRYINRLSSLLYALALHANLEAGVEERSPSYP